MVVLNDKRGIGIFTDYQTTERALRELKDIGYGMDHVSIIGQDSEHLNQSGQTGDAQIQDIQADDGNRAEDGAKTGVISGGTVGGLTGLLVGLGTLAIPGVGPIMLAGATATALATTAAGGAIGAAAGGLVGGLVGLGIPEDRAKVYNEHVSQGKYLVIIDGSDNDIALAEPILKRHNINEWNVYTMEGRSDTTHHSSMRENPSGTTHNSPRLANQSATTRNSSMRENPSGTTHNSPRL